MTELINEKLFYVLQNLNQPPAPISLSAYFCTSVNKEATCQWFANLLLSLSIYGYRCGTQGCVYYSWEQCLLLSDILQSLCRKV